MVHYTRMLTSAYFDFGLWWVINNCFISQPRCRCVHYTSTGELTVLRMSSSLAPSWLTDLLNIIRSPAQMLNRIGWMMNRFEKLQNCARKWHSGGSDWRYGQLPIASSTMPQTHEFREFCHITSYCPHCSRAKCIKQMQKFADSFQQISNKAFYAIWSIALTWDPTDSCSMDS